MGNDSPVTNDDLDEALEVHSMKEREWVKTMVQNTMHEATVQVLYAFPDGVEGHRKAHEKMIKAAEAEERFWDDLKSDVAKKSIWGILHILIILALGGIAAKLGVGAVIGIGK